MFLLLQFLCLPLVGVQLRKTVCGESSGLLLLQTPFRLFTVKEMGTQLRLAWPTGDVRLVCLQESGVLLMPWNVNLCLPGQSG